MDSITDNQLTHIAIRVRFILGEECNCLYGQRYSQLFQQDVMRLMKADNRTFMEACDLVEKLWRHS